MKPNVAVVIPAHDEQDRISAVLKAVLKARLVDEIIVVDDGSSDNTSEVARRFENVRVVKFSKNLGKAGAMEAGVGATEAAIIAFVDADLVGLTPDHVDQIVRPLLLDQCDMCIGVFRGGKFWSDTAQRITPLISGQRAIRREMIYAFPFFRECRMGAEVLLNMAAKRTKARVMRVILRGVSNSFKERKYGLVKGTAARYQMYKEITQAMVRYRAKKKPPRSLRVKKRKARRDRYPE